MLMKACDPIIAAAVIFLGLGAARTQDVSFGERLFRDKADCQSCHGINGFIHNRRGLYR
jgi:mono/diheme cytochrome c family protein